MSGSSSVSFRPTLFLNPREHPPDLKALQRLERPFRRRTMCSIVSIISRMKISGTVDSSYSSTNSRCPNCSHVVVEILHPDLQTLSPASDLSPRSAECDRPLSFLLEGFFGVSRSLMVRSASTANKNRSVVRYWT